MRHLKSGSKLGRNPWHRRATLRNLVTNLFEHGAHQDDADARESDAAGGGEDHHAREERHAGSAAAGGGVPYDPGDHQEAVQRDRAEFADRAAAILASSKRATAWGMERSGDPGAV